MRTAIGVLGGITAVGCLATEHWFLAFCAVCCAACLILEKTEMS